MQVSLENLLDKANDSVYKLVVLTAKRALEIAGGAPKLTDAEEDNKPITIALREISEGKVKCAKAKQ